MLISVVLPSRLAPIDASATEGRWFVERALDCIERQTVLGDGHRIEAVIGVDRGQGPRAVARLGARARVVEAATAGQAQALNAAASAIQGDFVAFLEDDDWWDDDYLAFALQALQQVDFVSSTQLERTPDGTILRIFDYPTPSSWVMRRAVWDAVGGFDPDYRWHLDSDWLGRLREQGARRLHFVEATAPITLNEIGESRLQLAYLVRFARDKLQLARHTRFLPLVTRTVHPGSGMARIRTDPQLRDESQREYARLQQRFGALPY